MEVEVVTADGKIQRASDTQNSDLFFVSRSSLLDFPSFLLFSGDGGDVSGCSFLSENTPCFVMLRQNKMLT
jgi:hypothetical protein